MKFINYFTAIFTFLILVNCSSEDDICTNGDTTPRIKIKFKTIDDKLKTLDNVFVSVDFGNEIKSVINGQTSVDSILIPLRVDDAAFTDIYLKLGSELDSSKIRINYTTKSQYVSPACGIRKTYENLNPVLEKTDPVMKIELNQNKITNEEKTSLYLVF